MKTETIQVNTGGQGAVADVTSHCERFVSDEADGLLSVFVPHATAGLAVMETGSGSEGDLLRLLDDIVPRDDRWRHRHGTTGHGRDHVIPALISPSLTVPVIAGRVQLGTWQSICLVDTNVDNHVRTFRLSFIPA